MPRGLIGLFGLQGGARGVFGSNVPLALLIDPGTWLVDALKEKKSALKRPKHFSAKIGQNWPKSAIRVMPILKFAAYHQ